MDNKLAGQQQNLERKLERVTACFAGRKWLTNPINDRPLPSSSIPAMNSPAPEPLVPLRLSEHLENFLPHVKEKAVSIREVLEVIHGRGISLVMIFLALPFIVVPVPGLSVPIGLIFILIGLRIAFGRHPWWPEWFLNRTLPAATLKRLIERSVRLIRAVEKWLKPRMHFLQRWPIFRTVNGLLIFFCGVVLSLPIPVPFTNTIPALAIFFLSMGMMEEDGFFILFGYALVICALLYLLALVWLGRLGLDLFQSA